MDGSSAGIIDRRRISIHWFAGVLLTGFCGAALMGGAVFASLDGQTNFASVPERFEGMLRNALGAGERSGARKGDQLPTYTEPAVVRQVIPASTTTRIGNREIVRVRPFVRIAGSLSLSVSDLSAHIPPFNPQRMLVEAASEAAPVQTASVAAPDAEVSFVTRDLAGLLPHLHLAAAMPAEQILAQVRQAANVTGQPGGSAMARLGGTRLAYAAEVTGSDPYAGFEARIVPENVTLLPKTKQEATGGNPWNERVLTAKKGDTIASMLQSLGATAADAEAVADQFARRGISGPAVGQKLRVLLSPQDGSRWAKPIRVIIAGENSVEAMVAFSDTGKYVSVDVQSADTEVAESNEEEQDGTGVRLYQSIYETGLRDDVPRPVIDDLIRIYSYDVDFGRKVQPGDSFEVMYAAGQDPSDTKSRPEVMFAEITVGGETKKFYRFQTPDDGVVDYYDEHGKSAKKFLVRKPVSVGIMRSGFGFRRHPILGYAKMHTGVDWAAPYGSPIFAAGDGVIEKAGWESGYGKYVRIRHNNGYETAYGHMSAFAVGIEEGVHVRQGQIIGFVGSTGLSTGAHVHYEILVNGRFVDPMRIRLPRGRALAGAILTKFDEERDRLDALMARAPIRTAQSTP